MSWVLSSTPSFILCSSSGALISRDQRYIVALDAVHWLYIKEWKEAYQGARVAGVAGSEKSSGVKHDGVWGRDEQPLGPDPVVNAELKVECFHGHHSEVRFAL